MIPHLTEPSRAADGFTLLHLLFGMGVAGFVSVLVTKFWEAIAETVAKWLVGPLMRFVFWLFRKEWKGFKKAVDAVVEDRQAPRPPENVHECVARTEYENNLDGTRAHMDELSRVVHTAAADMSSSAKETRETLGDLYNKVNSTREDVAGIKKTMELLPDAIVGKVLLAIKK